MCDESTGECTWPLKDSGCDDGVPCTEDLCDPAGGCKHLPKDAACDDGEPCSQGICDPLEGCVQTILTGACDDGDLCTVGDLCQDGVCGGGAPKTCQDGNPCTDDLCESATGACVFIANAAPCDDGDPCTETACDGGACAVVETTCEDLYCLPCKDDADCGAPGNLCLPEPGGGGACGVDCAGAPEACPEDAECVAAGGGWQCRPLSGSCKPVVAPPADGVGDVVALADLATPEIGAAETLTGGEAAGSGEDLGTGEPASDDAEGAGAGGCGVGDGPVAPWWLMLLIVLSVRRVRPTSS